MNYLEEMRARLVDLNEWEGSRPMRLGFFLYQGNGVADRARATWERYFREYLLKPILEGYTEEFKALPSQESEMYPYERIYDHVKTYVRVTSHSCDTPQLADTLMQSWRMWRTTGEDQADVVRKQFDFYALELSRNRMPKVPVDAPALKSGQAYLNSFSEEQRLYSQLVDEVSQTIPPAKLADYAPKYAEVLSGVRDVPGAFTKTGWIEMQSRIADAKPKQESCVLGTSVNDRIKSLTGPALTDRLQNLYNTDYARRWKEFIAGIQVRPYANAHDAEDKLSKLDDRAILGLMFMMREHTQMSRPAASAGSKLGELAQDLAAKKLEQSQTGRLAKQVANAVAPTDTPTVVPDPVVPFQPISTIFLPTTTNQNFNDDRNRAYKAALNGLRMAMRDLSESSNPAKDEALNKAAKQAVADGDKAVHEFKALFNNDATEVGTHVERLLTEPFANASKHYIADPAKAGGDALNGGGNAFCSAIRPLTQKYPFLTTGPDASLEEVSKVFNPQTGEMANLYSKTLSQYLVKVKGGYQKLASAPAGVNISDRFLEYFNRMARISDALYADGGTSPGMRYRIALGQNPPEVRQVAFTVANQSVNWPGGPDSLKIDLITAENSTYPVASYSGPWAIFSLMAEADRRPPGSRDVAFSKSKRGQRGQPEPIIVGGKEVTVKLRVEEFPGSVDTAFDPNFFAVGQCVPKIVEK
jgi:type VI secretion system protein ImpL